VIGRVLPLLLVLLVPLLVFQHVRSQAFVQWDDNDHVYRNMYLNPVAPGSFTFFWQQSYKHLYIPLSYTALAGLALIARRNTPIPQITDVDTTLDARVFHTASLIVHLVNVGLVYAILCLLLRRPAPLAPHRDWAAAIGALLFAIHPVQVESVAWVSEIRGLLGALFSLIALWLYLRGAEKADDKRGKPWTFSAAAAVVLVLAILCKPSAVSLALMALALDRWAVGRPWRKCLVHAAPVLAVSIVFALVTRHIQPPGPGVVYPLGQRPFVAGDALAFYLEKLVLPRDLGIIYGRTPEYVMAHWWGYATWLVPAALGVFVWMRRKRNPWLLAACGVSLAALLPVLGFIPFLFQHFSTVADRYLYLALLGPAFAAARLLSVRWSAKSATAACAVLAALGCVSIVQVRTWDDTFTLELQAVAVNPHIDGYHARLATVLTKQGRNDEALDMFSAGIAANPDDTDALYGLAGLLMTLDKPAAAVPVFQRFLRIVPDGEDAHFGLATALFRLGRYDDAIPEFAAAARLRPDSAMYRAAYGSALATIGRKQDAIAELRAAVSLQPDYAQAQQALRALLGK
jgi:tetratricopeptide (TPR) repeat protein